MKNLKKFAALGCCITLTASALSGCGSTTTAETETAASEDITVIEEALEDLDTVSDLIKHSETAGKEETVYAILTADGSLEQTIVSEWLKNPEGSSSINDISELSDIRVVKGTAEYSQNDFNNQIVWSNDGSDIYYQGTSTKDLPVDVRISYELDGQSVTAEELSGASGHLKMTFTYNNQISKQTTIKGEKRTIYQPFFMISGMMLDNEKAQNISVDHGSTVNSGDATLVFGAALPGLKESLGLDNVKDEDGKLLDLEIPESVTIEADVTDFSLMMTLTVASNNALSQLGLDDIDSIDDLKADMDKLTDGMDELMDGATQLNNGAGELQSGVVTLSDGTNSLADGTSSLSDGAHELSDGASEVNTGAVKLKNGVDELKEKTPALVSGVDQLSDGLNQLYGSLTSTEAAAQLAALTGGSKDFQDSMTELSAKLGQIVNGYQYEEADLGNLLDSLTAYAVELKKSEETSAYGEAIQTLVDTYESLYTDVSTASGAASALSKVYGGINDGITKTVGSLSTVSGSVKLLSDGANALNEKVPALEKGVKELSEGASDLADGTKSLSKGASSLANGADEVNNGTSQLKNGVSSLLSGVNELADGTLELSDGVIRFNEEGIQKLADVIGNDLETYYDRLKAVQDFAKEYTSYAGCKDDVECSVKFIYKTDAIE